MSDESLWIEVAERANEILGMGSVEIDCIVWDCTSPAVICEAAVKAYIEILEENPKSQDLANEYSCTIPVSGNP